MSETNDIIPSGDEADLQEQGRQAEPDDDAPDAGIEGEETRGSEADRLEQATAVPFDGDDAYPRGAADDDSAP